MKQVENILATDTRCRLLKPGFVSSDYFSSLRRNFVELVESLAKSREYDRCSVRVIFEDAVVAEDVLGVLKSVLDVVPAELGSVFDDLDTITDFVQLQTWRGYVKDVNEGGDNRGCFTFILSVPCYDFLLFMKNQEFSKFILCDGSLINVNDGLKKNVLKLERRSENIKESIPSHDIHELIVTNFLKTL